MASGPVIRYHDAAAALTKSLFALGADFTSAMVFMVASTNLVVELGIVLWLLLGWQFAVAEFVGGAIMIVLLAVVLPRVIPTRWTHDARARLNTGTAESDAHAHHAEDLNGARRRPVAERIRSLAGWSDAAGYTISDLTMLRKELLIGFLVGWRDLLRRSDLLCVRRPDHAAATVDLPPLLRHPAHPAAAPGVLGRDERGRARRGVPVFTGLGLVPAPHAAVVAPEGVRWNGTTILNILALIAFAALYGLSRNRGGCTAEYKDASATDACRPQR